MTAKIVTFFEGVGHWLKKFFTNATLEQQILATLRYSAPILEEVATLAGGPAAGAALTGILTEIQTGLATVATLASGAIGAKDSTTAKTIANEMTLLKQNLGQIMGLAEIKDPATQQKIEGFVNTLVGEVDAALQAVSPPAPPAPPAAAA